MNIKIHQIFYDESQRVHLDNHFVPYNNEGKNYPFNFEYAVFFDLYKKTNWSQVDLLGTVSWKFSQKTGLSGEKLLRHISENPGMDVYFVNPFPELSIYNNVWEQGDAFHPELTKITSLLLKECGYSDNILSIENPPNLMAYCNYWVANKKFWDAYIQFLTPLWTYLQKGDSSVEKYLQCSADALTESPYLPFIFERLFSSFLSERVFKVSSLPIYSKKHARYPYLSGIYARIAKVSQLKSRKEISLFDKILILGFHKTKKVYNYHLPSLMRKLKK